MARATNTLPVHTEHIGEMEEGMGGLLERGAAAVRASRT